MTNSTATKTTGIGVIFGMWTRYEVCDAEAEDFYSKYDQEEWTDEAFPLMVIIWDGVMNEVDSVTNDYPKFPADWTKGAAVLEASHAYFEVEGEVTDCRQITIDGIKIVINGEAWDADDWDVQEIESAIDIATGEEIELWG